MRQSARPATRRPPVASARAARHGMAVALAGVVLGALLLVEALARAAGLRAAAGSALALEIGAAVVLAVLVGVGGLLLVRALRRLGATRTTPMRGIAWDALSPVAFEREVARLFARAGYRVEHVGAAGDGGVDVRVWAPGRAGVGDALIVPGIVQCKRYAAGRVVGPATVRELIGARAHEHAATAWLATTGRLTPGARRLAAAERIAVLDAGALAAWDARLR